MKKKLWVSLVDEGDIFYLLGSNNERDDLVEVHS